MVDGRKVFDVFPFFDELDVLEIRLHEMDEITDRFVILEAEETYGGAKKSLNLHPHLRGRFAAFEHKMEYLMLNKLDPPCTDRVSGRLREADQRNAIKFMLDRMAGPEDVIVFSDCDEIPRAAAVLESIPKLGAGIHRLKQNSYYYNVNRKTDYGHDWASRARVGLYKHVAEAGSMYEFRMARKNTEEFVIEDGGWHFGYFGDVEKINRKVAALAPFLKEYQLFGDVTLARDIVEGKDLHHRRCEMPEKFQHCASDDPTLPAYFLAYPDKFAHFTIEDFQKRHAHLLGE